MTVKKIIITLIIVFSAFLETANAAEMSEWAKGDYSSASEKGLIPMSIAVNNLTDNVTRGEFCNLAMNMFDTLYKGDVKLFDCPFTDCNDDYIVKAYSLGIVHGKTETEFCPFDSITRQEMAKILVNVLETAGKKLTVSNSKDEKAYSYADFSDVASWAVLERSVRNGAVPQCKCDERTSCRNSKPQCRKVQTECDRLRKTEAHEYGKRSRSIE